MAVVRAKYLTPHFRETELACRCRRADCDAVPMDMPFMRMLEALRVDWGKALLPTSGARCAEWNARVGGAPKSQHVLGKAADFWFQDTRELKRFLELAEKHGFKGIGHGRHLVHLDNREGEPARWIYQDK